MSNESLASGTAFRLSRYHLYWDVEKDLRTLTKWYTERAETILTNIRQNVADISAREARLKVLADQHKQNDMEYLENKARIANLNFTKTENERECEF